MFKRKTTIPEEELFTLEKHLAGTLKPVAPSKHMIQRLRSRIRLPDRSELVSRLRDWRRLLFVFGGVMTGMLALITLARAFYSLTARKGM